MTPPDSLVSYLPEQRVLKYFKINKLLTLSEALFGVFVIFFIWNRVNIYASPKPNSICVLIIAISCGTILTIPKLTHVPLTLTDFRQYPFSSLWGASSGNL